MTQAKSYVKSARTGNKICRKYLFLAQNFARWPILIFFMHATFMLALQRLRTSDEKAADCQKYPLCRWPLYNCIADCMANTWGQSHSWLHREILLEMYSRQWFKRSLENNILQQCKSSGLKTKITLMQQFKVMRFRSDAIHSRYRWFSSDTKDTEYHPTFDLISSLERAY